eukprot:scaffold1071_cov328-Pavlova_lutheri.AAC.3
MLGGKEAVLDSAVQKAHTALGDFYFHSYSKLEFFKSCYDHAYAFLVGPSNVAGLGMQLPDRSANLSLIQPKPGSPIGKTHRQGQLLCSPKQPIDVGNIIVKAKHALEYDPVTKKPSYAGELANDSRKMLRSTKPTKAQLLKAILLSTSMRRLALVKDNGDTGEKNGLVQSSKFQTAAFSRSDFDSPSCRSKAKRSFLRKKRPNHGSDRNVGSLSARLPRRLPVSTEIHSFKVIHEHEGKHKAVWSCVFIKSYFWSTAAALHQDACCIPDAIGFTVHLHLG